MRTIKAIVMILIAQSQLLRLSWKFVSITFHSNFGAWLQFAIADCELRKKFQYNVLSHSFSLFNLFFIKWDIVWKRKIKKTRLFHANKWIKRTMKKIKMTKSWSGLYLDIIFFYSSLVVWQHLWVCMCVCW